MTPQETLVQKINAHTAVVGVVGLGYVGLPLAVEKAKVGFRVIGVEPSGAPTLYESLRAGRVITLDAVDTAANTLAPRRSAEINFALIRDHVDDIVLVGDEEMRQAARWLWREMGVAAELAGAASLAALRQGRIDLPPGARVCAVVSGTGDAGMADP